MRQIIGTNGCGCNEPTCYACRRYEIDERAVAIYDREVKYCTGMSGFDIEEHAARMANDLRCKATYSLAAEFAGITN